MKKSIISVILISALILTLLFTTLNCPNNPASSTTTLNSYITTTTENQSATTTTENQSTTSTTIDPARPSSVVKLIFIHHSCGSNWLSTGNGNLGSALNANNYYVSESDYGWDAEPEDNLGDYTDTNNWDMWFNDTKAPYVYASDYHSAYTTNSVSNPGGENEIIMFKSCYPFSEVGGSIDDEKTSYNSLLTFFSQNTDKLFVIITPPGETEVSSYVNTKELCNWLVDRTNGWLKDYEHNNVFAFDFYCVLSEIDSHHRISNGAIEYVYSAGYDGTSPYHDGDDHPTSTGNQKATNEFIPLLNHYYNLWKN